MVLQMLPGAKCLLSMVVEILLVKLGFLIMQVAYMLDRAIRAKSVVLVAGNLG